MKAPESLDLRNELGGMRQQHIRTALVSWTPIWCPRHRMSILGFPQPEFHPLPYQPNASEVAVLTVLLIQRYSAERGKEVSRFRLARTSLRRLAIRDSLRDALVDDWIDVMALEWGWLTFKHGEEFLLLKADTAKTWTKIATKRCDDIIKRLRRGDKSAIDDAAGEIDGASNSGDDDDDE